MIMINSAGLIRDGNDYLVSSSYQMSWYRSPCHGLLAPLVR